LIKHYNDFKRQIFIDISDKNDKIKKFRHNQDYQTNIIKKLESHENQFRERIKKLEEIKKEDFFGEMTPNEILDLLNELRERNKT